MTVIEPIELTILMPCLNEAETLEICVSKAMAFLHRHAIEGEVLIADNGSTDGSQELALSLGARVLPVPQRGYGAALIAGIAAARGKYVIMGDSDDSYDFEKLTPFVEMLRAGWQLVMGNRFTGGIARGAMPALHRYFGNPVLTRIGRIFFRSPVGDFHCGLRGFHRQAILGLGLRATGMEFASEMVVKATVQNLRLTEVATTLSRDGRSRPPHLRSWRDGWRHLRFLLAFCPRWLFLLPGLFLFVIGSFTMLLLMPGALSIGSITLDVHTLLYAAGSMVIGFQAIQFWAFARIYGALDGILPPASWMAPLQGRSVLEGCLLFGGLLVLVGLGMGLLSLWHWSATAFGPITASTIMRISIGSVTAMILGAQLAFAGFFVTVLETLRSR